MLEYLKVKVKSLAAEARIIRLEAKKAKACNRRDLLFGLHEHRIFTVRRAARSSNLAYGFLLGNSYLCMEKDSRTQPAWKDIETLLRKYGSSTGKKLSNHSKHLLEEGKALWQKGGPR